MHHLSGHVDNLWKLILISAFRRGRRFLARKWVSDRALAEQGFSVLICRNWRRQVQEGFMKEYCPQNDVPVRVNVEF